MNIELYFTILLSLQPDFLFIHAENLLEFLENFVKDIHKAKTIPWSNPLMVMVLTLDLLYKIDVQFNSLTLRVNDLSDRVKDFFIQMY